MEVMQEHLTYCKDLTYKNFVVIFGSVAFPDEINSLTETWNEEVAKNAEHFRKLIEFLNTD